MLVLLMMFLGFFGGGKYLCRLMNFNDKEIVDNKVILFRLYMIIILIFYYKLYNDYYRNFIILFVSCI